jgi:hypothetical protein
MTAISSLATHQISASNSTTSLLGSSATFTGAWEDVTAFSTVAVAVLGSVATDGTLYFDLSTDGGSTFTSVPSTVGDTTFALPRILNVVESHVRIRYVNGTTAQTGTFSLQTKYSNAQPLGLLGSVDGTVTGETPTSDVKAIIVGEELDGTLQSTGIYKNVSLLQNDALKTATPPTVIFQVKRPTDPAIPSGAAVTVDPVVNAEANVADSGWIPALSFGGGSLLHIISDVSLNVYVMNSSDTLGNNIQGNTGYTLVTRAGFPTTIGAPFFDDYVRVLVENTSGSSANEYSIRMEGGQTPGPPVFTSLDKQTFKFFPAPLSRVVNSPSQDRNFGYIGDQEAVRFRGVNTGVPNSGYELLWNEGSTYNWPTTAETFRIRSGGGANDDAAGTGARSIKITYLDSNWEVQEEIIATAGASASAPTSSTGYRVLKVQVVDVGTIGGTNDNNIRIENSVSNDTVGYIQADTACTCTAVYTVPANKTLYIKRIDPSVGSSNSATIRLRARPNADVFSAPYGPFLEEWSLQDYSGAGSFGRDTFLKFDEKTDLFVEAIRVTGSGTAEVGIDLECFLIDN